MNSSNAQPLRKGDYNTKNKVLIYLCFISLIIFSVFYLLWSIYRAKFYQCSNNNNPPCQRLLCSQSTNSLNFDSQSQNLVSMFNSLLMQSDHANAEENGWNKTNPIYGAGYCADTQTSNFCSVVDGKTQCCYKKYNKYGVDDPAYNSLKNQFTQLNVEVLFNQLKKKILKVCTVLDEVQSKSNYNSDVTRICETVFENDINGDYSKVLNRNLIETLQLVTTTTQPEVINTGAGYKIRYKTCNLRKCASVYPNKDERPIWGPNSTLISDTDNCFTCDGAYNLLETGVITPNSDSSVYTLRNYA